MKKILIVAALVAASVLPAGSVSAAAPMAAPKAAAQCFFLPLLPDCTAAWKAEHDAMMAKMAPAPKTAMAVPKMMTMPSCTKAAAGAGHLYDCKM
jgi:hypothetical protein